jgi:Tfp pilus assembly pilus retraction ATPase PilT
MQLAQSVHGMQTFNQSLADLVQKGLITVETAKERSSDAGELQTLLEEGKGLAQVQRQAN